MRILHSFAVLTIFTALALTGCGGQDNAATKAPDASATKPAAQADQVKAGVTQMLDITKQLKQAIDTGDQAKVKAIGPKLEDTWGTFEDAVKPKYPDLYEKIEKSLDPEVAGSKASTLDKQTLGKLNDQLTQTLNELLQKLQ